MSKPAYSFDSYPEGYTIHRITEAEEKAREAAKKKNLKSKKGPVTNYDQEFLQLMVQRLNKITNIKKVNLAIRFLKEKGYDDVVDVYEGRVLMDHMLSMHGTAKW